MSFSMQSFLIPIPEITTIFADLEPIPQDDSNAVCVIDYPTSFRLAYDYIRAIWACGEKSDRACRLSATCLKLNPANYTVWHFRRQCLQVQWMSLLSSSSTPSVLLPAIQQELQLTAALGGDNPKNYQIWYHRRVLLDQYGFAKSSSSSSTQDNNNNLIMSTLIPQELEYIANVLEEDAKNYHAWSHRQWVLKTVNQETLWQAELEFVHKLIRKDIRNNSAWNQRWMVVHRAQRDLPLEATVLEQEFNYVLIEGTKRDPYNESPWRYWMGLVKEYLRHHAKDEEEEARQAFLITRRNEAETIRQVLIAAERDPEACARWTAARIDVLELLGDDESLVQAIELAQGLADRYDRIRARYWEFRVEQMNEKKTDKK